MKDVRGKFLVCSNYSEIENAHHYRGWSCDQTVCFMNLDESVCILQDRYQSLRSKEKLSIIKSFYEKIWSENLNNKFVMNFTNCIGLYCPELVAKQINPELEKFINKNKGKKFGAVLMDVPTDNLISAIYNSNFS